MRLLYGHSDVVAEFVSLVVWGDRRGFGGCTAIGVLNDGDKLIAGIVYHNWEPEAGVIEVTGGAVDRRWLTRANMKALFGYPFDQLDCQMVIARHKPSAKHLRRIWRTCGAEEYVIKRGRGRDEDLILATLTEEAWSASKFMRSYHE